MDNAPVIDVLRRLAGPGPDDVSDADLLGRFVASHDPAAFEALVRRHGRLVWGTCRRRLRDAHAAEDAFQTTFLALARHASAVRRPDALAAWLHRVAVRCSAEFRPPRYHMSASFLDIPARGTDPAAAAAANDLERLVDCEIDALPEPFRLAFVLCEVEQRTAADAAKTLGCPVGTIESRLTRARKWLRARLVRRGITVGSLTGVALAADAVPASARSGAVALATGMSPVPPTLASVADRVVRSGLGALTVGVGLCSGLGIVGLGGLLWVLTQAPVAVTPVESPAVSISSTDLPIPEQEQFRRNRDNFPLPPEAIARLGDAWLRHGALPQRMAFSGDGRFLATGGAGDRWLRVWDLETNRPRVHLWLAAGEVPAAVALTVDGRVLRALICTGDMQTAQLREYDTFRGIETHRKLVAGGPMNSSAFSSDGRLLALATGGRLRMIDTASASERWRTDVGVATERLDLAFAANGRRLAAVATGSDRMRIFDADTGRGGRELIDSKSTLSLPTLSADGRRLAAWCSTTQRIRVWDADDRELVNTIEPRSLITGLAMTPDGTSVVAFASRGPAVLWPVERNSRKIVGKVVADVYSGTLGRFSPDGAVLAVATQQMAVQLVDMQTGTLPASPKNVFASRPVAFASDGGRLLLEGFQSWIDYPLRVDESPRGYVPGKGPDESGVLAGADRAAVSPDRTLIARCTRGKKEEGAFSIDLLDAQSGEIRRRIDVSRTTWRPAFSPDGRVLYALSADRLVHGWDVRTGREVMHSNQPMSEQTGPCTSQLIVSPDSKHLAVAQKVFGVGVKVDTIRVIDASSGEQVFAIDGAIGDPRMAFSADGTSFAAIRAPHESATVGELCVWESCSGRLKVGISGLNGQPAFSPDGRTVAVTHDHGVVLIEVATGQARHEFRHHGKVEPALAWRSDGRVIAAASPEAPVYLWDVVGDRTGNVSQWNSATDDTRWAELCESDAAVAFQSLRQLWSHPAEAVAFLKERMPKVTDARVATRVCEALELIATPEARQLLRRWASAETTTLLSGEAASSLRRLPPI